MKYLSQLLFVTTSLLSMIGSTTANGASDAHKKEDLPTNPGMIYLDGPDGCSRKQGQTTGVGIVMKTVNATGCDEETRRSLREIDSISIECDTVHPTGGIYKQLGNAIEFREDITGTDSIKGMCLYSQKDDGEIKEFCDPNGDVFEIVDCKGKGKGKGKKMVKFEITGLFEGDYKWSFGNKNKLKHEFKVTSIELLSSRVSSTEIVEEAEWNSGGKIQDITGRLYFFTDGEDYACTGTVIKDRESGRTLIITAAHCIWDDIVELWVSDVVFIPNRDAIQTNLTGSDVKRQCDQDICGCWTLSAGVVLSQWRDAGWPARLKYDYGLFVVDDEGMHEGPDCGGEALDIAVGSLEFEVGVNLENVHTHSLGYSLEHNPDFRYCAENTRKKAPTSKLEETYWLDGCGLTGGASGGPWVMDMDDGGYGKIVSVNSWSLSKVSGMGGPIIEESAARCLVNAARDVDYKAIAKLPAGEQGIFVDCHNRPCIPREEAETRRLRGDLDGRKLCEE